MLFINSRGNEAEKPRDERDHGLTKYEMKRLLPEELAGIGPAVSRMVRETEERAAREV